MMSVLKVSVSCNSAKEWTETVDLKRFRRSPKRLFFSSADKWGVLGI